MDDSASETTSARPSPASIHRLRNNVAKKLSEAISWLSSKSGRHWACTACRTLPIQPIPEYSASTRPMMPTVNRAETAWSRAPEMVLDRSPGICLVTSACSLSSRSGRELSTNPAAENATIMIGTRARNEK